jgi:hypothetical protein
MHPATANAPADSTFAALYRSEGFFEDLFDDDDQPPARRPAWRQLPSFSLTLLPVALALLGAVAGVALA